MLVVLDPAFFQENGIDGRDPNRRRVAMHRLRVRLDQANVLLTHPGARLVLAVDSLAWFDLIFRDHARSIEDAADRPLKQAFARLREHRKHGRTLPGVTLAGQMWGVVQMAEGPTLAPSRRPELEAVLAASVTAHGPGRHPYCPPSRWMNSRTTVWETHQSRPCWLDAQGQWWARPATGGGHHWDVYLNPDEEKRIGLDQINVTQHGAPANEGEPGMLHHVPGKKLQALKTRSGWRCPT